MEDILDAEEMANGGVPPAPIACSTPARGGGAPQNGNSPALSSPRSMFGPRTPPPAAGPNLRAYIDNYALPPNQAWQGSIRRTPPQNQMESFQSINITPTAEQQARTRQYVDNYVLPRNYVWQGQPSPPPPNTPPPNQFEDVRLWSPATPIPQRPYNASPQRGYFSFCQRRQ